MHGTNEHQKNCPKRHLLLQSDVLEDDKNQFNGGTIRYSVLQMITPTEYIVRPILHQEKGKQDNWKAFNSDEFVCLDAEMQVHYKRSSNLKLLDLPKPGDKCVILECDKFYRAEIIECIEKR